MIAEHTNNARSMRYDRYDNKYVPVTTQKLDQVQIYNLCIGVCSIVIFGHNSGVAVAQCGKRIRTNAD